MTPGLKAIRTLSNGVQNDRMKRAPRQMLRISNIEVSAFAAILVVLVFLFAGSHDLPRISVDLVKSKHPISLPNASREDAITVLIERDGSVFFGTNRSDPKLLPHQIQESLANGAERRVYLSVDRYAKYETVKQVIDAIHSTGVEQVTFFASTPSQQK